MTRYLLSPTARRDITDIWLYTADRWGVDQADNYVRQIEEDLHKAANGLRVAQPIGNEWKSDPDTIFASIQSRPTT